MASQVNRDFFKKAKKVDRAIEIRDNEAVIPAVKERAEVRARLPNRRVLSIEERATILEERKAVIAALENEIEIERKVLLEKVKIYDATKSGAGEVVAHNLKVKMLMEKRSNISYPETWIEGLSGLSLKDIFGSKRDDRKIGADVFQIKRRVEPILSLYVDLEAQASVAQPSVAQPSVAQPPGTLSAIATALGVPTQSEPASTATAAQGVIIGQKRVLKSKRAAAAAPASGPTF